ncbi:MAG: hypothetical protein AABY07_04510 [Nanoarchaeota archaeon]
MNKRLISLLLSFVLVIILINAVQTENPGSIKIFLDTFTFGEGVIVDDGDVVMNFSGPVSVNTFVKGEIGDLITRTRFTDLLDNLNIDYIIEEGEFTAENPEPIKNLVFQGAGKQYMFFRLPKSSVIKNVDMDIKGIQNQNSYPSFVNMDVKDDGNKEWNYIGNLVGFGNFILPNGLNENTQGTALVGNTGYYCELINLPSSKDFEIHAKYGLNSPTSSGNISAVIFSVTGTGNTVNAQGGANKCDLPEPASTDLNYDNCVIHFNKLISGNKLVCVYNHVGTGEQYKLAADNNQNSGYKCNNLGANSQTSCTLQPSDFFIKVKAGNYSGTLSQQVPFTEGLTEFLFNISISSFLNTCTAVDNICVVPVSVSSNSKGIIQLSDLELKYQIGGTQFIENNFYDGTASDPGIVEIDGEDLLNDTYSLEVPIEELSIVTPIITQQEKNFTLRVSFEPGPSHSKVITIKKTYQNITTEKPEDLADAYKGILNDILGKHENILETLKIKSDVSDAISQLTSFKNQLISLNTSNKTEQQKVQERNTIRNQAKDLVEDLPRILIVSKSVTDTIPVGINDIVDDAILQDQRTDAARNKLYRIQDASTVEGTAKLYEVTKFDGTKESGTLITKKITSQASNAYIVEIIPDSAARLNDIIFETNPEVIKQSNPAIVRWLFQSLFDQNIDYAVKKDMVGKLGDLKTLIVPQNLEEVQPPHIAECGDGICSYVEAEGEKLYLEDKYSCPADCKKKYPMSGVIIGLVLIAIIIYYVNYYKGKYNFGQVWDMIKNKFGGGIKFKSEKPIKSLFISKTDEGNLRSYVKNALDRGIDKGKVTGTLLNKGWTREQIDYIFKELKK